jgi:predicted DNA-binding transcriptional regulator AlpA
MNEPNDVKITLLNAEEVAQQFGCTPRHLTNLVARGKAPAPVKLGRLTKWIKADLDAWVADGCKPVRNTGRVG